jgi:hypothetical protein
VVSGDAQPLPAWVTWQRRPFPDANLLLIHGRQPALVDRGFVGHAEQTAAWASAHTRRVALVVNTIGTPITSAATRCCTRWAAASPPAAQTR